MNKKYSLLIVLAFLLVIKNACFSQEFFLLNHELQLYCVYDPSSTGIATYRKKTKKVIYSDFDTQINAVNKRAKKVSSRIKTLKRMKKDGTVSLREKKSFKKIYKYIHKKKYRENNEIRISKFNSLIRKAKNLLSVYLNLVQEIEKCSNRDLDLSSAQGLTIQTLVLEFNHPIHKVPHYLAGVALVTTLSKRGVKKGGGVLCVGKSDAIKESTISFSTNLCSALIDFGNGNGIFPIQYYFKCSARSAGLSANSGVFWIDWGIYAAMPSDKAMRDWESLREKTLEKGYRGRPYVKSRGGCLK